VVHLVALDGVDDGLMLGLVHELRRVDPDDHHGVAVLVLELAQLVQDMQTVDAAKCPEINNNALTSHVGEGEPFASGVEPAALANKLGSTDTGTAAPDRRSVSHGPRVPPLH
jgi:hypothetical protein